jgi:ABC-2 type transport system permease protein
VRRIVRQPAQFVFPIVFPLVLLAVNASGLEAATQLPGFPSASYLDFALAIPFMQGALFAALNGGQDLARDIESGFLDRLALTPMSGAALLAGQLGGALFMGVVSAVLYLVVGLAFGVGIAAGFAGALVLLALAITISFAFACFGTFVALRAGSGEAVQGFFPLFFVLLFLSSAFFPRDLIEQDWFRTIATYNPVSYMVEGIRSLVIAGWDGQALAQAFGLAGLAIVAFLALSSRALRTRLQRT